MNPSDQNPSQRDPRQILSRASLNLTRDHVRSMTKRATTSALAPTSMPPASRNGAVSFLRIKSDLHQQLLTDLDRRNLISASEEQLTEVVEDFVTQALQSEELPLNEQERRQMVDDLLEETIGVGPLALCCRILP
ncbi:MAG: hypothetical protein U0936_27295 [Planctomycetaceae bacterium]